MYADFRFTPEEIEEIRVAADADGEVVLTKEVVLMDRAGSGSSARTKTLYVATRAHYREKLARRAAGRADPGSAVGGGSREGHRHGEAGARLSSGLHRDR